MADASPALPPVQATVPPVPPSVVAPPAVPAVPAPAPAAAPSADAVALQARLDRLEDLILQSVRPAAPVAAPVLVPSIPAPSGCSAWVKTVRASKCAANAVACAGRALNGIRTILFFGVSGALGLSQEFGAIDITPLLSHVLPEGSKVSVSQAVVLMSFAGLLLRLITKTPAFTRWSRAALGGTSSSSVDEPAK